MHKRKNPVFIGLSAILCIKILYEMYKYYRDLANSYQANCILKEKVKDKIIHYQELQDNYIKKYDEINEGLQAMINVLKELLEESEENWKWA